MRGSHLPQILSMLLSLLLLGGCQGSVPIATITAIPPSASSSSSITATSTPTLTPTITPTLVPVTKIDFTPSPYQGPLPEEAKVVLGMGYFSSWEVSPDGNYLAVHTGTNLVILYDIATWEPLWFYTVPVSVGTFAIQWSPDNSKTSICTGLAVFVLDTQTGRELFMIDLYDFYPQTSPYIEHTWYSVEWSPDGKYLALHSDDDFLIDADTGTVVQKLDDSGKYPLWPSDETELSAQVKEVISSYADPEPAISPDKTKVAVKDGGATHILDAETGSLLQTLGQAHDVRTFSGWSPDGTMLAVVDPIMGTVWDVETAQARFKLNDLIAGPTSSTSDFFASLVWSSDSNLLLLNSYSEISLWDVGTGMPTRVLTGPEGGQSIQHLPGNDTMVLFYLGGTLGLWDLETGQVTHQITASSLNRFAWSEDSSLIAAQGNTWVPGSIWDVTTGEFVRFLDNSQQTGFIPEDKTLAEDTSPDGSRSVTVESPEPGITVMLRNTENNQLINKIFFPGLFCEGHCVTYKWSPDSQWLAVSDLYSVQIHRADTGSVVSIAQSPGMIDAYAFSPNSKLIAAQVGDAVIVWEVP